MDTISTDLRNAVAGIVGWYDRVLEGQDPTLTEFARCIAVLRSAGPYPGGQIGEDIAHLLEPGPKGTRIQAVEAIDRLRHLVRTGTRTKPIIEAQELPLT